MDAGREVSATGNDGGAGKDTSAPPGCRPPVPTLVESLGRPVDLDPSGYAGGEIPQLDLDGPDPDFTYNDPHVLHVGAEYWMYASATVLFDFPVRLYRLSSSNGSSWRRNPEAPIFDPGATGSWDAGGVETPAVVYFRGEYHLFYTGYPVEVDVAGHDVLDYRIGHAVSCDGVSFTRVGSEPLVAPSGTDGEAGNAVADDDWYAFIVGEPGTVVWRDRLYVYFTAVGADGETGTALQVIGVVSSDDGLTWTKPELVAVPDATQFPRVVDPGPPVAGFTGYSTPNAIVLEDQVHLFFDVAYDADGESWRQVRLHHAVADHPLGPFSQDDQSLLEVGAFDWALDEVRSPSALVVDETLRLYFAGHELDGVAPDHFAIGMLTQAL